MYQEFGPKNVYRRTQRHPGAIKNGVIGIFLSCKIFANIGIKVWSYEWDYIIMENSLSAARF